MMFFAKMLDENDYFVYIYVIILFTVLIEFNI